MGVFRIIKKYQKKRYEYILESKQIYKKSKQKELIHYC
jgi:hypothetical protein